MTVFVFCIVFAGSIIQSVIADTVTGMPCDYSKTAFVTCRRDPNGPHPTWEGLFLPPNTASEIVEENNCCQYDCNWEEKRLVSFYYVTNRTAFVAGDCAVLVKVCLDTDNKYFNRIVHALPQNSLVWEGKPIAETAANGVLVGVAVGCGLAFLATVVIILVVLIICRRRRQKVADDEVFHQRKGKPETKCQPEEYIGRKLPLVQAISYFIEMKAPKLKIRI